MSLTVPQLTQWRDRLIEARLSGIRELEDQNGERIVYRTDREMQRAIDAADREIAHLYGQSAKSTIYFKTSKGVS
ncbi:MAG: hypothetical protein AAF498_11575 [Pseudomonadota bacterium]